VWADPPHRTAFPIARAGLPLIGAAAFATVVLAVLGLTALALTGLAATLFICYFFRDPDRATPTAAGCVVSPADGRVVATGPVAETPFFEGPAIRVGIFMSVFNVHVNRIPYTGTVSGIKYTPGAFLSATREKAAMRNEHNAVYLETDGGHRMCVVQIAGLIARRIICAVQKGDRLERGQRFGLICFGSRLDVYLPPHTRLSAKRGDKVKAGSTILGVIE
jgi:phosphatidylserine decarboxylase